MWTGRRVGAALAGALLIAATTGRTQEDPTVLLERARQAVAAEDWTAAFTALEAASLLVFARMPLTIRRATFVTNRVDRYGDFDPRPDAVFRPGEPLMVYLEPLGYAFRPAGDGRVVFGFAADVTVFTAGGRILGGQREFGRWEFRNRLPSTAGYVWLRLALEGLPVGDYRLAVRIRDLGSDEAAEVELPFSVAAR